MRDSKKLIAAAANRKAAFEAEKQAQEQKQQRLKKQNRLWLTLASGSFVFGLVVQVFVSPPVVSDSPAPTASNAAIVPDPQISENRAWSGSMQLNDLELEIELDGKLAPQATANFLSLANSGFYKDISCHRLTNGGFYVLQCGDPNGDGSGGPGYSFGPIENAPTDNKYPRGTIAMARVGNDSSSQGSQFFIVYEDTVIPADSAGGYTVFGRVTDGLDKLADLVATGVEGGGSDGKPVTPISIGTIALN